MATLAIYGLPYNICRRKVDDLFYKFGKITNIYGEDGIVYVTYSDNRDALDAYKNLDGFKCSDYNLIIRKVVDNQRKQKLVSFANQPIIKQKSCSFSDQETNTPFNLNVQNAKCSVNIDENGHGSITITW